MIDIIKVADKQFIVTPGRIITVPRLAHKAGETLEFTGLLTGAAVMAEVVAETRLPKVMVCKFHNKTRYERTQGHRQPMTQLRITEKPTARPKATKAEAEASSEQPKPRRTRKTQDAVAA